MKLTADEIGVDAGIIIVADLKYLKSCPSPDASKLGRLGKTFKVPKGKYEVHWFIPIPSEDIDENLDEDNYQDDYNICEGHNELTVTSGTIFVCDPCYVIGKARHQDWLKWLENTKYGDELNDPRAFTISSMGGDGCYRVEMDLEKID